MAECPVEKGASSGMNLVQVSSYTQMKLIGLLLILAVILDQQRCRLFVKG